MSQEIQLTLTGYRADEVLPEGGGFELWEGKDA